MHAFLATVVTFVLSTTVALAQTLSFLQFSISRLLMFATPGKLTLADDWIRLL